jgi:single-strand DNA-binding protein
MAGSVNKVLLIGNVGKDPEIRRTQDGRPIASFSIATSESWRDKNSGERKERTEWHNVVIFNEGLCKIVEQYLKKGSKVYVEGAQKTRKWTDKDGKDRYSTETVLQGFNAKLELLSKRDGGSYPGASDPNEYGSGDEYDFGSPSRGDDDDGGIGSRAESAARDGEVLPPDRGRAPGPGRDMDDEIPF